MYKEFYGLKESPFELTPDPQFLFLSEKHSDALKYLVYGIKKRKGFILITGEVGTGKTTLCRYLLDELNENIQTAFLLNPSLSEKELLEAILVEFGLDTAGVTEKKDLLHLLNQFLLRQLREGKNAAVIIDEAQNLPPQILEQLRILSNLETDKEKLIQIILVGQPELDAKLQTPELRQLGQRISLRFHLKHLNAEETEQYIKHRLSIAGSRGDIQFTPRAIRKIYAASKGYPRSINVMCDQALIAGCYAMTKKITPSLIKLAIRNTLGQPLSRRSYSPLLKGASAAAGLILAFFVGLFFTMRQGSFFTPSVAINDRIAFTQAKEIPLDNQLQQDPVEKTVEEPDPVIAEDPDDDLAGPPQIVHLQSVAVQDEIQALEPADADDQVNSLYDTARFLFDEIGSYDVVCMAIILKTWGMATGSLEEIKSWLQGKGTDFFSFWSIARNYGFNAAKVRRSLWSLRDIGTPCILLGFHSTQEATPSHSVVLMGITQKDVVILDPKRGKLVYSFTDFQNRWSGRTVLVWKTSVDLPRILVEGMTGFYIRRLDTQLREAGYFQGMPPYTVFNAGMKLAVEHFQKTHGLKVDGIVGPVTQFVLQKAISKEEFPKLNIWG